MTDSATTSANVTISEPSTETVRVDTSGPSDSTIKGPLPSSHPESTVEAASGGHSEGGVPNDSLNSVDLDSSLSSQRVDDSFIFQNVSTGHPTPTAIPGLDLVFKEGVDFRNNQVFKTDASNSDMGVNHSLADKDHSSFKNISDNSNSLVPKDKGSAKEPTSYDPRRPLSLPLPPAVGDEDMEEDEEFNNNDSVTGDKVDGAAEGVSPIIPMMGTRVGADLTDIVSDAVR